MGKTLIEKITYILDQFTCLHAKAWEIGTDFFSSWMRLSNLLKSVPFNNSFTKIKIKEVAKNSNNNKMFQLVFGGINVTPRVSSSTSVGEQSASQAAIRQYLQEGSALSYVAYSDGDRIEDGAEFSVSPQIWKLKQSTNCELELINVLLNTLKNSTQSNVYFVKNLGYSLFLSLIDEYDWEIFKKYNEHYVERIKSTRYCSKPTPLSSDFTIALIKKIKGTTLKEMKLKKTISENIKNEFLKFGSQIGKRTYETACVSLLNYYSFEEIVNEIYFSINYDTKERSIFSESNKNINDLIEAEFELINGLRSQFREKVFKNRKIEDLNIKYCDLSNAEKCKIRAMDLDACHIYDVEKIKKRLQNLIISNNYERRQDGFVHVEQLTNDPNNCLLMSPLCHKMFDRNEIWFDTEGKLCYRKETEQYVKDYFSEFPQSVCIKPEIFNEEMKQHLINKVSENNN